MGAKSRNKGARGEVELAKELTRVLGVGARRGRQFCGSPDSPDVLVDAPDLHVECKRVERFDAYKALDQATRDAGAKVPIVAHRRNRREWIIVCRLDDLPRLAAVLTEILQRQCSTTKS